jgi:hypothetical protein
MKLLKMKIRRTSAEGCTRYVYPKAYDAYKVVFGPIYESGLPEKVTAILERDADDEFILIGVRDEDYDQFMLANKETDEESKHTYDTVELTQEEATALGSSWTAQTEKITDKDAVTKVLAKAALGTPLTEADRAVLDPDNATPGINKTESFESSLLKAAQVFLTK